MKKKTRSTAKWLYATLVLMILLQACTKDDSTGNSSGGSGGGGGGQGVSYTFDNPVNIKITPAPDLYGRLIAEYVTRNYIFSNIGHNLTIDRYPIGSTFKTTLSINPSSVIPAGYNAFMDYMGFPTTSPPTPTNATLNLFTVDKAESNLYMLSRVYSNGNSNIYYYQIYKLSLGTLQLTKLFPDITNALDVFKGGVSLNCIRVSENGDIFIASSANNGSIAKVNAAGNFSIVASNLINPGFFDIQNADLYVPINSANGRVIKINGANVVTELISSLTGPTNVALDNYGNLLVRSRTTVAGGNYHRYDLYKTDGTTIGNVKDASGSSILSNIYENTPMSFDSYNNLYFYHADGVVNGGLTYNNPIGQKGLFKMGIIKN